MTDPVVELEPVTAAVEPGGQTRVVVTVINDGSIVEGYRVDVLDDLAGRGRDVSGPSSWAEVLSAEGGRTGAEDEPDLTVYPGQQQSVVVVFSPPVGIRVPGGRCAFAVRVSSVIDPDTSTVVEGDLDIGKVSALQAKLVPVTSTGRWRGRHVVELSNWGNTPARLTVVAEDPDRALGFLLRPDTVELPVGASQRVRLSVRTRRPKLRGTAARLPFTVRAKPTDRPPGAAPPMMPGVPPGALPDPETATVDGAFTQKPILTKGVVIGAGLTAAVAVALTAYGLTLRGDAPKTFQDQGVPDTPEVSVEATGPEAVLVSWAPIKDIEMYKLFRVDAQGTPVGDPTELDPAVGAEPVEGLAPDQEFCFSLTAVRGELQSPLSEPGCARTEEAVAAPETESPTTEEPSGEPTTDPPAETTAEVPTTESGGQETTGSTTDNPGQPSATETTAPPTTAVPPVPPTDVPPFDPGEWAAVLGTFPDQGSAGEFAATQRTDALVAEGVAAVAVATEEFPDLGFAQQGWLVVLEDGFASSGEASGACQDVSAALPTLVPFCDPPVQPIAP